MEATSSRIRAAPLLRSSGMLTMQADQPLLSPGGALIIGKRAWQVGLSGVICFAVLNRLADTGPPRLFALHVACMAPMLPLGAAALSTVRQRLVPPAGAKKLKGEQRRKRGEWLVIRHFLTSASALYLSGAGMASIWLHKRAIGKAHLTSVHSWLGVSTWALWLAAYLAAQPHVWRDQLRARKFSLLTNKRWLWASSSHRRLGTIAYALSLAAYCSGMLGWRALERRVAATCCVGVVVIGARTLGKHGAKEARRGLRDIFCAVSRVCHV